MVPGKGRFVSGFITHQRFTRVVGALVRSRGAGQDRRVAKKRKSLRVSPTKKKGKTKSREASMSIDFEGKMDHDGGRTDDADVAADAVAEYGGSIRTRSSDAQAA
ncbi:hypothetical protein PHYPSEUDO_014629 [Phytophthora pseudosyringae]|uniref:Uncharacterized protein n=1 Tax=Phytophthora pseudosyringae TaxID=221518 RepID=A0A8T1V4W2_9STRA|nr:hypothetical protein PHYPSEUDO_014629 [Phytophthora pseudosyringae]